MQDVIRIPVGGKLHAGKTILISPEDAHLADLRWTLRSGYASRVVGKTTLAMHRQIMGLQAGDRREVDHINGDKLDNRRENLRVVTHAENGQNVPSHGGASKYRGVYYDRRCNQWYGQVKTAMGKRTTGYFANEEQAHEAVIALRAQVFTHHNEDRSVAA